MVLEGKENRQKLMCSSLFPDLFSREGGTDKLRHQVQKGGGCAFGGMENRQAVVRKLLAIPSNRP